MSVPGYGSHPCNRCGVAYVRGPYGGVCMRCWDRGPGYDPLRIAIADALHAEPNGSRAEVATRAAREYFAGIFAERGQHGDEMRWVPPPESGGAA